MDHSIQHIAQALKKARQAKGLSQRALSRRVGIPQGHISRIENAAVDLTLSSLIQLSRALHLELMLVPRKLIPAVQSLVRSAGKGHVQVATGELKVEEHTDTVAVTSAYSLDEDDDSA